ncbi:metal-dependent amidase/aminoacylase/carboxypeptidase [Microbacterium sp. TS-1]|uniref:hypothetical protein n=1 Tax=Microbacterium sp. TS-1 TaxID=1344956 RepID=UPI00038F8A0D|nr:hypothetical protein [Microbacterium sp. TS-1]GAD34122.1 metal-dependent amidase/aminoacylase/carboxypeptidase [Microbacterium sp. TS-1]
MSLLDPREAARREQAKFRGATSALVASLIWGILSVAAAGVVGFAIGGIFEQLRAVNVNSVFGTWDTGIPVAVRGWGLPVGILLLLVCIGQYGKWNHRFSAREKGYAAIGPLTIILAGLAIGTWVATTMWIAPDAIGVAVDPTFGQNEPWGVGEWILYAGQWWLPGLLALLAVLSYIARVRALATRRRNNAVISRLLASGSRVEAEIVEAPLPAHDASRMAASLVAKFTDAVGTDRWVTTMVLIAPREVPAVGDTRPLVFDPADPGDTTRIFLSPTGKTGVDDFEPVQPAS